MIRNLYATAAKGLAVTISTVTAMLVLFDHGSRSHLASMEGRVIDAINIGVLLAALVAWADIVWHDIRGRLIWPSLNPHIRHHICVLVYASLAASYGLRLFSWADLFHRSNTILAVFYLLTAGFIGLIAVAIALETRDGKQN